MERESVDSPLPLALPALVHDLGTQIDDSQTQYSITNQALSTTVIEELRDYRCFETPQGWVLALDPASLQTFLWRPQDGERIQLPPMEDPGFPARCKCLLSDRPGAASGCAVVVFDLDDMDIWVCKIGANEWDNYGYTITTFLEGNIPQDRHIAKCHGVAAVGGKIYYELSAFELGVIEFNEAMEPGGIDVDMVDLRRSLPSMASTYLVESCGELFLVIVFFDGDNFHKIAELAVYKMDFSKPAWCKVDGIGADRVFLLGGDTIGISSFGASCSAGDHGGLRGNCVYFLNHLAITENFLHVFDLENGTEQVQRPFEHKGFLTPLRAPFWLLPTECNP